MLDALGVTYTQHLVLSALWETDGLTIGAIGDRLALEPGTITPTVKRLEAAGFVARQRSVANERLVEVRLMRKGGEPSPQHGLSDRCAAAPLGLRCVTDG